MTRDIVAIVGSRGFPDLERVREYVRALPADAVVIHGGAFGVDETASDEANRTGRFPVRCRAPWQYYDKAAGPLRNEVIALLCNRMVAFWDGMSPGTKSAIAAAQRLGKPVEVISP